MPPSRSGQFIPGGGLAFPQGMPVRHHAFNPPFYPNQQFPQGFYSLRPQPANACDMPYNLAWGGEIDAFGKTATYSRNQGNMPPATPDPKMSYTNISSLNQPPTRGGGLFPYQTRENYPMASPMYMPFMNESPRPETRAARYQNQNSGNFSLTINYNDYAGQNRPQQ